MDRTPCAICNDRIGEFRCSCCGRFVCMRCCQYMHVTPSNEEISCKACSQADLNEQGVAPGTLSYAKGKVYVWTRSAEWLEVGQTLPQELIGADISQTIKQAKIAKMKKRRFGESTKRVVEA